MDMRITPSKLSGTLEAISSKSFAHRLLICASLADRQTRIRLNSYSDDIMATVDCLRQMGAVIETNPSEISVVPIRRRTPYGHVDLHCGESGSTARFLLPLAAYLFDSFTMTGSGRLPDRPMAPLCEALTRAGCVFNSNTLPITGSGQITPGDFHIPGDISSQFISALLFTLPLLHADSNIILDTPAESDRKSVV